MHNSQGVQQPRQIAIEIEGRQSRCIASQARSVQNTLGEVPGCFSLPGQRFLNLWQGRQLGLLDRC